MELKDFIKTLSAEQKDLKKKRKTGKIDTTALKTRWVFMKGSVHTPQHILDAWAAANTVQYNKIVITAALNLYHEMRGSTYRHGVASEYKRQVDDLREKFMVEKLDLPSE